MNSLRLGAGFWAFMQHQRTLPGPEWPPGTVSAATLPLPAACGKHTALRCHVAGEVVAASSKSKRLLFFSVREAPDENGGGGGVNGGGGGGGGESYGTSGGANGGAAAPAPWMCLAKAADGFLSAEQIAELAARLQRGTTICLLAYPELAAAAGGEAATAVAGDAAAARRASDGREIWRGRSRL